MRDLHNNIKVVHAITPQAIGTSGVSNGKTSAAVDRAGYDSVEFVFSSGATASAADTVTPVVFEADATDASFTSVADANLIGLETALTLTAAKTSKIGYTGNKRYVKIKLWGVGHATGIVSATAILGHNPAIAPVA